MKPKRTDKILLSIFLAAVVVAVLIAAVVVFDPTGILRVQVPVTSPRESDPPRTPGVDQCVAQYAKCTSVKACRDRVIAERDQCLENTKRLPEPRRSQDVHRCREISDAGERVCAEGLDATTCKRVAAAREVTCREDAYKQPEPERTRLLYQCAVTAAQDLWNCTSGVCRNIGACDNQLIECIGDITPVAPVVSTPPSN